MTRIYRTRSVPRVIAFTLGAGVFLLVLLGTQSLREWPYSDWVAVSAASREALVYAGPWGAAWCAWVAARYVGLRSLLCLPSASRSGAGIVRAQMSSLLLSAILGFILGYAPLLVETMRGSTQGQLDLMVVFGSLMVLMMFCCLGYLIGCILGRLSAVILAVVLSFSAILLVDTWGPVIAPLRLSLLPAGWYETAIVSGFRVFFFAGLAVALGMAATSVVARRATRRTLVGYVGLSLVLVPALIGLTARSTAPAAELPEQNPPMTCANALSGRVCVHAAKAVMLPKMVDVVNQVLSVVDNRPAVPIGTIYDAALGREYSKGALVLNIEPNAGTWPTWEARDVAYFISGQNSCRRSSDAAGEAASEIVEKYDVTTGVASWIMDTAGFSTGYLDNSSSSEKVADRLRQMPLVEAQQFYQKFSPLILNCGMTLNSLQ